MNSSDPSGQVGDVDKGRNGEGYGKIEKKT